jgi:hypothetical protein
VTVRVYVDSDVLIWHLRGEPRAAALLRRFDRNPETILWTGAMQRAEVAFFMRPEEERLTLSFLGRFRTQPLTQEIVDLAGVFYRRWHRSHGVDVNDMLLAGTVATTGGRIVTLNLKHYPMDDVTIEKGW